MIHFSSFKSKIIANFSLLIFVFMSITIFIIYFASSNVIKDLTVVYANQTIAKVLDNIDYILKDSDKMSVNYIAIEMASF